MSHNENHHSNSSGKQEKHTKSLFHWLAAILLIWGIPTLLFWQGLRFLCNDIFQKKSKEIFFDQKTSLDTFAYQSHATRYLKDFFSQYFKDLKGLPATSQAISQVIQGFYNQWPKDFIEIHVFDGNKNILKGKNSLKEYELLFKLISAQMEGFSEVTPEQINKLGKILPFPDIILKNVKDQNGKVIKLGNPDKYSMVFFDHDPQIKNKLVSGILVFVHLEKMSKDEILSSILRKNKNPRLGFINSSGKSNLPQNLAGFSANDIQDRYELSPTNSFCLKDKLISLKRLDPYRLLVAADNCPNKNALFLKLILLGYLIFSILAFHKSYQFMVLKKSYTANFQKFIISLFILSFAIPFFASILLTSQYLRELKNSLIENQKRENYSRLSDIDAGFKRFVTSKLINYRNLAKELTKLRNSPQKLIEKLDKKYQSFAIDSLHLVASDGTILYSNDLMTAEVRRHFNKSKAEKEIIYQSWKDKQANITPKHLKILNSNTSFPSKVPDKNKTNNRKAFEKLLKHSSIITMQHYNKRNNITRIQRLSGSDLVINSFIESKSHSLLQSAKNSLGEFIYLQGIDEIHLAFVNIIAGPMREAWYTYTLFNDLINLERQYLENFYSKQSNLSKFTAILDNEDIRAASMHQFAQNFPSYSEFKTFDRIFKKNGDFKTISLAMPINGKSSLVSALKCSNLKHYILLKIIPESSIIANYSQMFNLVVFCLVSLALMGFFQILLLKKLILNPITEISKGAKAFSKKDLSYRIPCDWNNELGQIARSFNDSVDFLEKNNIPNNLIKELIPQKELRVGSHKIYPSNKTAKIVPTDFYHYFPTKQNTAVIFLAEISGKDSASVYLMSMLKTALELIAPEFPDRPNLILEQLNKIFLECTDQEHMITCFLGFLDPTNDSIICSNAGQPYPLLIKKDGTSHQISLPSTPLGVMPSAKFSKHNIPLENQKLFIHSSGILNLSDSNGNKLGSEGLAEFITESFKEKIKNPNEQLMQSLSKQSENSSLTEDLTFIVAQTNY